MVGSRMDTEKYMASQSGQNLIRWQHIFFGAGCLLGLAADVAIENGVAFEHEYLVRDASIALMLTGVVLWKCARNRAKNTSRSAKIAG